MTGAHAMMGGVKRQRMLTVLTLSAALVLSGCGGPGSEAGVSVNGTDYSVEEVQEATQDLAQWPPQTKEPQQVIRDLALLPFLDDLLKGTPVEVTDAQIRQQLTDTGVNEPSDATVDAARARHYQIQLSDPATLQDPKMSDVAAKLQGLTAEDLAADVQVNPRYGTWDPNAGGLTAVVPEWIQSSSPDN